MFDVDWEATAGRFLTYLTARMVGLAPKWVRLDPKWDKPGAFSDQISVHLAPPREPNLPFLVTTPFCVLFNEPSDARQTRGAKFPPKFDQIYTLWD